MVGWPGSHKTWTSMSIAVRKNYRSGWVQPPPSWLSSSKTKELTMATHLQTAGWTTQPMNWNQSLLSMHPMSDSNQAPFSINWLSPTRVACLQYTHSHTVPWAPNSKEFNVRTSLTDSVATVSSAPSCSDGNQTWGEPGNSAPVYGYCTEVCKSARQVSTVIDGSQYGTPSPWECTVR